MSNLDDKLLGEKKHYYCDSSSDNDDNNSSDDDQEDEKSATNSSSIIKNDYNISVKSKIKWEGTSCNTGPKGVIEDFQRYKKFENEKRNTKNNKDKMKKSTINNELKSLTINDNNQNDDLDNLDDENDPFINEYITKRMKEMLDNYYYQKNLTTNSTNQYKELFGKLLFIENGEKFLNFLDNNQINRFIIITHIYNNQIYECNIMNSCLDKLAKKYNNNIIFCSLNSINVGMSRQFTKYGVPALLVYKNGELIGNFVSLGDEFGTNFNENDVEDFLVENNILISSQLISSISITSNLSKIEQQKQREKSNEN